MSPERLYSVARSAAAGLRGGLVGQHRDLVQEGALLAWEMRGQAEGQANPDGWLVRAVQRRLVDLLRRVNGRRPEQQQQRFREPIDFDRPDHRPSPLTEIEARDAWEHVRGVIGDRDAGVIERYVIHGDWPKGAGVLSAVARARRVLADGGDEQ